MISVAFAIIGYIFIFDPPYYIRNNKSDINLGNNQETQSIISKCSYRMWSFDLSLNLLYLGFINKVCIC